jgi:hypothetical protein
VKDLRVIDCRFSTVIPAPPSCSYVALSYVWGTTSRSSDQGQESDDNGMAIIGAASISSLPKTLPSVVRDAITFTRNLGFLYLWIDKYCIDQNNANIKHEQIMQMDRIYKNAEVTLIAAAGEDQDHGLPGVGNIRQPVPPSTQIGNIKFTYLPRDPTDLVRSSKWFTRGWTFQEGALVRWNHVSNHALTVLGIAPPELYINPLVLHYFMYFRQLLMQLIRPLIDLFSYTNPF